MTTTRERIDQAEEALAQLQNVLDHTQSALAVVDQVEVAARRSRRLLKFVLLLAVLGVVIAIIMKVTRSAGKEAEKDRADEDPPQRGSPG